MTALQIVYPNVPILTCIQLLTGASIICHYDIMTTVQGASLKCTMSSLGIFA